MSATVVIKGTNKSTRTDIDGNYQIEVDSLHTTLIFNAWGHERQEIRIENDSVINVVLVRERVLLPLLNIRTHIFVNSRRRVCDVVTTDRHGVSETYRYEYVIHGRRGYSDFLRTKRRIISRGRCGIRIGKSYRINIPEVGWTDWIKSYEHNCVTYRYDINGEKMDSPISIVSQEKNWEDLEHSFWKNQDFLKYIDENLRYLVTAIEQGIMGTTVVGFTVNPDGSITNVKILRNVSQSFSEEVLSVVQSAPKFDLRNLSR